MRVPQIELMEFELHDGRRDPARAGDQGRQTSRTRRRRPWRSAPALPQTMQRRDRSVGSPSGTLAASLTKRPDAGEP
jgi:hypothetical protein